MLFHCRHHPGSGFDIEQLVCSLPEDIDSARAGLGGRRNGPAARRVPHQLCMAQASAPLQVVHATAELPFVTTTCAGFPRTCSSSRWNGIWTMTGGRGSKWIARRSPVSRFSVYPNTLHPGLDLPPCAVRWALVSGHPEGSLRPIRSQAQRPANCICRSPAPTGNSSSGSKARRRASEDYWRETLQGFRQATPLVALDGVGPASTPGMAKKKSACRLDTTTALRRLSAREGFTLNTVVQGAWALLLSRYSNSADVVFGVTRACRSCVPRCGIRGRRLHQHGAAARAVPGDRTCSRGSNRSAPVN